MTSDVLEPHFSSQLVQQLRTVLLDLHARPYPFVPSPPNLKKRASVALILRIRPHYSHWPPERNEKGTELQSYDGNPSTEDKIKAFFEQEWVQHGDPEVLFIKRAPRKGDRWQSHVAFPGGGRDPEDADDRAAAVRETWEEVGMKLAEENSIAAGNLPQRIVTSFWGKKALMVLCPYIFILTEPYMPPLRLQPTEVGSAHWVSLRALLSPSQRTYECQDISGRVAKQEFGVKRWLLWGMIGKMLFAAIRLIPSESVYCTSIPGFIPDDSKEKDTDMSTLAKVSKWWMDTAATAPSTDKPLLLWGLTLGIIGDFTDMLPPHNAIRMWTYPTLTTWDLQFILWAISYRLRKRKDRQFALGKAVAPASDADTVAEAGQGSVDRSRHGEVGISGLGIGNPVMRSSTIEAMLEEYYECVRKAIAITLIGRTTVALVLATIIWKRYRRRTR